MNDLEIIRLMLKIQLRINDLERKVEELLEEKRVLREELQHYKDTDDGTP